MPRAVPILFVLALLPACREEAEDTCGAEGYRALEGAALAAVTLPADLDARITGPDIAATLDHRPDRLNLWVNAAGVIERLYCG